jgi:hypothetical protein
MAGYTRQSSAEITSGEEIKATPLNNEFNAVQAAFSGTTGHTHDGSTGNGPQINLTASVTGRLPLTNVATIQNMKVWGNVSGITGTATEVAILDEDTMVSDSAISIPTQQSVKAYADTYFIKLSTSQVITGLKTIKLGTAATALDYLAFEPTDWAVGKPGLYIGKSSATQWDLDVWDGSTTGTLNFNASSLTFNGTSLVTIAASQTLTNKTLTSPTMTGTPVAPTATPGTNTTQVATTAFVTAAVGVATGGVYQPLDSDLTAIAALTSAADRVPYATGSGTWALATFTSFGRSLVDDADASTARTTLGLGTIATQASSAVTITGGSVTGITDLAVADGGTGASTASAARTNLGLGTVATSNKTDLLGNVIINVYTANATWTKPSNLIGIVVEMIGGGGGSGGIDGSGAGNVGVSGAGGGGAYLRKYYDASALSATEAVVVGLGGTAGAATAGDGGNGGNSTFKAATAGGGIGGAGRSGVTTSLAGAGGAGGTASGGDLNIDGRAGTASRIVSGTVYQYNEGGSSFMGAGGAPQTSEGIGDSGKNYGGGASGSVSLNTATNYAGNTGAPGLVIITEYRYVA